MEIDRDDDDEVEAVLSDYLRELATDPWNSGERLLAVCCDTLDAEAGRLVSLSAETGHLQQIATYSSGSDPTLPPFEPVSPIHYSLQGECCGEAEWVFRLPATDQGLTVGAIEILLDADRTISHRLQEAFSRLIPLVRANHALRAGLRVLPPIPDVSGDESEFRYRVHEYLDGNTRAKVVAVYAGVADSEFELIFGPGDSELVALLSSDAVHRHVVDGYIAAPTPHHVGEVDDDVREIAGSECLTVITHSHDRVSRHSEEPEEEHTYVLLLGFPLPYTPSAAEIAVFEHALAVAAYLNEMYVDLHRVMADTGQIAEIGSAITGLETSQMVRHHAKTQIELAQNLILEMKQQPRQSAGLLETLSKAINSVGLDLQTMKEATRAPSRETRAASLKEMWDVACSQVRWRLATRRVEMRYQGPDLMVDVAPEWYRQVFLNLLLNSADAYDARGKRHGKIVLNVTPLGDSSGTVQLTYADDAMGISPQHFLECEVAPEVELSERVFRPGVTSKTGGSGWGLYVCRNIVKRTPGGSISLGEGRGGAVFHLTLRRA